MCRLLDIDKVRTSGYHPQCNGLIERFHRTLNAMLGKTVETHQRDWDERLPYVLAAYRGSIHEATGFSPNLLVYGRKARAPIDLVYGQPKEALEEWPTYAAYLEELMERMRSSYETVRRELGKAAERRKRNYELRLRPLEYQIGDWVWFSNPGSFWVVAQNGRRTLEGRL